MDIEINGEQVTAYQLGRIISKEGEDGMKFLGSVLANSLNGILCRPEKAGIGLSQGIMGDHRTLQQMAIGTLFQCLLNYATAPFDGRNEASVKACGQLASAVEKDDIGVYFPLI